MLYYMRCRLTSYNRIEKVYETLLSALIAST